MKSFHITSITLYWCCSGNQTIEECLLKQETDYTPDCIQCPNDFMTRMPCGQEKGVCDSLSFQERLDRSLHNI